MVYWFVALWVAYKVDPLILEMYFVFFRYIVYLCREERGDLSSSPSKPFFSVEPPGLADRLLALSLSSSLSVTDDASDLADAVNFFELLSLLFGN